jgi:hypothetical protein
MFSNTHPATLTDSFVSMTKGFAIDWRQFLSYFMTLNNFGVIKLQAYEFYKLLNLLDVAFQYAVEFT